MQVFWGIFWVVMLLIGFVLLVKGADFFVDGASGLAAKLKVSTFVISDKSTRRSFHRRTRSFSPTIRPCIPYKALLLVKYN